MNRWMPGVERHETAAQGGYGVARDQMRATAVVMHVMEGWLSTMIRWSQERPVFHEASYTVGLGLDGRIVQFVPIDNPAWHAGRRDYVDAQGRSVKRSDSGARLLEPTWPLWEPSRNPGGHTVAIAREGFAKNPWTPEQLEAAPKVIAWAMEQHDIIPSRETLIGHYELNSITRANDPGGNWDKDRMLDEIARASSGLPDPLSRVEAMWAVYRNGSTPVRVEGGRDVFEFSRRQQ